MSTRERWIVYPLLFMTLGIALRDKVITPNRLAVGTVVCNRLQSNRAECHTLLVNDPAGRPVVVAGTDANTGAGIIETFTARGIPQVRLFSTDTGGMLTTFELKRSVPQRPKKPPDSEESSDRQPTQQTPGSAE